VEEVVTQLEEQSVLKWSYKGSGQVMENCECLLLQLADGRCGRRRSVVYLSLIIGSGQEGTETNTNNSKSIPAAPLQKEYN
jgi:hypothetical protein